MRSRSLAQGRKDARKFRERHYLRSLELARNAYYNHREVRLAGLKARYDRERDWFNGLKDHPCLDCDLWYPPCVMEFDHARGVKRFTVSRMVGKQHSRATILAEIAKCDLVCANCHRLRTWHSDRPITGNTARKPR